MHSPLADKARAGRRAALATLSARLAGGANVVSLYQGRMQPRRVEPLFHSVRQGAAPAPRLVHAEHIAA